ncbi:nucleotide-binding protein [Snodgrassella alvi]|uniref:nucleotide-binding protein n=1 Tax=Snodgrassella alvi TaxID=1196083 RepID=UPI0027D44C86|nr:ParA family protein [Snodgrassella alvi]
MFTLDHHSVFIYPLLWKEQKDIAVLNQKGGSGKTTIATYLARVLQLEGHQVLLVDSDP